MSTLIEFFEDHTTSRSPEDFAEDFALGLSLTGILLVLLSPLGSVI